MYVPWPTFINQGYFAAANSTKPGDNQPSFPVGYPFENLQHFSSDVKDIVKFFNGCHCIKSKLSELQNIQNLRALAKPARKTWGPLQKCMETVLDSESVLHGIVCERDFIYGNTIQKQERTRIKNIITDVSFKFNIIKNLEILRPIDKLTVKYQSDSCAISEILPDFHQLPRDFEKLSKEGNLTNNEFHRLAEAARQRFQFMYGKAHGLSYFLDPRFIGYGLSEENRKELEDILVKVPADYTKSVDDTRRENLYMQFTDFFISDECERKSNSFRFKILRDKRKTPLQYWQADGVAWPLLQDIAIKLFAMAPSKARVYQDELSSFRRYFSRVQR
jgi:hypothetical protein